MKPKTSKPESKFKVGDTVFINSGSHIGKATTITGVVHNGRGFVYMGFYCGKAIVFAESHTVPYR